MKIGIMTFHWATNFGAILQAYALQSYLTDLGHQADIINYKPFTFRQSLFKLLCSKNCVSNLKSWIKERNLQKFRNDHFTYSSEEYYLSEQLKQNPPEYDIYITGSDQVWNPYFLKGGEKKQTFSYFLDFGKNVIKCAYAVSFGTESYDNEAKSATTPIINTFKCIGVRENSGLSILDSINFKNDKCLVPDPTLLFTKDKYLPLINNNATETKAFVYIYILRNRITKKLYKMTAETGFKAISASETDGSVSNWLFHIKNAKLVITNSYHGMLFCLQFHTPFIILTESGKLNGMNDRFSTVLSKFNLKDRMFNSIDKININSELEKEFNWDEIDAKINDFRQIGQNFIKKQIINGKESN